MLVPLPTVADVAPLVDAAAAATDVSSVVVAAAAAAAPLDVGALARKAVGGGASGALAGVVQVLSLMWLRTAMNCEYAAGGASTWSATRLRQPGGKLRSSATSSGVSPSLCRGAHGLATGRRP